MTHTGRSRCRQQGPNARDAFASFPRTLCGFALAATVEIDRRSPCKQPRPHGAVRASATTRKRGSFARPGLSRSLVDAGRAPLVLASAHVRAPTEATKADLRPRRHSVLVARAPLRSFGSSFRSCNSVMSAQWPMPLLVDCGGGKPGTSRVMPFDAGAMARLERGVVERRAALERCRESGLDRPLRRARSEMQDADILHVRAVTSRAPSASYARRKRARGIGPRGIGTRRKAPGFRTSDEITCR